MTNNYKKNTNYNRKIYFWINKQIAFDKKISDYKLLKKNFTMTVIWSLLSCVFSIS